MTTKPEVGSRSNTVGCEDEAFKLIEDAQGSVKLAVVMKRLGLGRDAAQIKLNAAGGHLHKALAPSVRGNVELT